MTLCVFPERGWFIRIRAAPINLCGLKDLDLCVIVCYCEGVWLLTESHTDEVNRLENS